VTVPRFLKLFRERCLFRRPATSLTGLPFSGHRPVTCGDLARFFAPSPAKPSSAAWPAPLPTPATRSSSPSNAPAPGTSHAPWNYSPTRSTPNRRTCPATGGSSLISSPRPGFNCNQPARAGGLGTVDRGRSRDAQSRRCTALPLEVMFKCICTRNLMRDPTRTTFHGQVLQCRSESSEWR
jgi:hypothetical protein